MREEGRKVQINNKKKKKEKETNVKPMEETNRTGGETKMEERRYEMK